MSDIVAYSKWDHHALGNSYIGCAPVERVSSLPPGMYSITEDGMSDGPLCTLIPRKTEAICSFNNGVLPRVIEEVRHFWDSDESYKRLGLTQKRGILLHGPAGCGKTQIVAAAMNDVVDRGGIAMMVHHVPDFANNIPKLRQIEPDTKIVAVIEDIDVLTKHNGLEKLILEMLDGSSSIGGNILYVCTTNNLNDIPARIRCRPSRIDTLIAVNYPCREHRKEYISFLAGDLLDYQTVEEIADSTSSFSLADIKEVVICSVVFKRPVSVTLNRLRDSKGDVVPDYSSDDAEMAACEAESDLDDC